MTPLLDYSQQVLESQQVLLECIRKSQGPYGRKGRNENGRKGENGTNRLSDDDDEQNLTELVGGHDKGTHDLWSNSPCNGQLSTIGKINFM